MATKASKAVLPRIALTYAAIRPIATSDAVRRKTTSVTWAACPTLEVLYLALTGIEHRLTLMEPSEPCPTTLLAIWQPSAIRTGPASLPMASNLASPARTEPSRS